MWPEQVGSERLRRGLLVAAAIVLITACGGGDDHVASTSSTTEPTPSKATIPDSAAPGKGWLSLEGESIRLHVTGCRGPDPAPADPTAQRRFELGATAKVDGEDVVVRALDFKSDSGDATTLTQTVTVASMKGKDTVGLEAKRSHFNGHWLDLNEPSVRAPLFQRQGSTLVVSSKFGPEGSRQGDPGVIDGAMIAACPQG